MYISNSYAPAHKTGDRDMQWIFLFLCLPFVPSTSPSLPKDYGIAVAIPMTMLGAFKLLDSIIIIAYCFTCCLFVYMYLCSHSLTRSLCCFCFSFRCVFGLFFIDFDVCYLKSSTSTVLHTKISSRDRAREYQRVRDFISAFWANWLIRTKTGKMNCFCYALDYCRL